MAKFTKLIKDGSGGGGSGEQDRDYWLVMCNIQCSGSGSQVPLVDLVRRADENSTGVANTFVPSGRLGGVDVFKKIPKGYQIKFNIGSSAEAFEYFKSEKLGFNITTLNTQTEWFDVNEDIDDLEIKAYKSGTNGGGSN